MKGVLVAAVLCASLVCAAGVAVAVEPATSESSTSSETALPAVDAKETLFAPHREIVCWGDSLTAGMGVSEAVISTDGVLYDASYKSYPRILQDLTGIITHNCGVSGATSSDIVLLQQRVRLDNYIRIFDARAAGDMLLSVKQPSTVLVIEMGSNGGWDNDYDTLIEQYRSMLEYAQCEDYLILGDTDDPGTSVADLEQATFWYGQGLSNTAWEQALEDAFGDHFVNTRVYLLKNGLDLAGLKPTWDDLNAMQEGRIPEQLRADWTHLNSYGYYAKAQAVYERGIELGYWD